MTRAPPPRLLLPLCFPPPSPSYLPALLTFLRSLRRAYSFDIHGDPHSAAHGLIRCFIDRDGSVHDSAHMK